MGLIFRKRIKILPGLTVNFGKRGTSFTIGKRGASVNIGKRGTYANVGIPGTGISYRERIDKPKQSTKGKSNNSSSKDYSFKPNPYMTQLNYRNKLTEKQTSTRFWIALIVLAIVSCVCFYSSVKLAYHFPGMLLFFYSLGSIALAFSFVALGFIIDTNRSKESYLALSLGSMSLILTALVFFIWTCFWPSTANSYRMYYGHRIPEFVDLEGWVTFGRILAGISAIIGFVLFFIGYASNRIERKFPKS